MNDASQVAVIHKPALPTDERLAVHGPTKQGKYYLIPEGMLGDVEPNCARIECDKDGNRIGVVLKWTENRYAAFSPDGRGAYEVAFVAPGLDWHAGYYERGEEPLDLATGVSLETAKEACEKHAKERR